MARTYDYITAPGGNSTYTAPANTAHTSVAGRGRVLVNSGFAAEVTDRNQSLIYTPLWKDPSATKSTAIWVGGGVALPASAGKPIPYNKP